MDKRRVEGHPTAWRSQVGYLSTVCRLLFLSFAYGYWMQRPLGSARAPRTVGVRVRLTDNLLPRFIVWPERKLLFCYIDKVACTKFNGLFNALRKTGTGSWFRNTPRMVGMSKADLEKAVASTAWTKAVFFRDPVARFASAVAEKCRDGYAGNGHCLDEFGARNTSFASAVRQFGVPRTKLGRPCSTCEINHVHTDMPHNVHFMPQVDFCGGVGNVLHHFQFVRELNEETVRRDVEDILDAVGVKADDREPALSRNFPVYVTGTGRARADDHETGATSKLPALFAGTTAEEYDGLVRAYSRDYAAFNATAPSVLATRTP